MSKEKLQIIDDLILSERFCVLATHDGIEPLTSLMSYFVDHASMKFYFLSKRDSQKTKNLKKHPHVSIFIDRREENIALSIQGVYAPIKNTQTVDAIINLLLMKRPHLAEFSAHPDTELIRIEGKKGILLTGLEDKFETKF